MLTDRQPPQAPNDGVAQGPEATRTSRRSPLVNLALLILLVAVVTGAIWGISRSNAGTTSTTQGTAKASATPVPHVLYQADWSQGADGWKLPVGAKIVNGNLVIDSKSLLQVPIPYVPTGNYALEMDFQIEAITVGGHFGFTVQNTSGENQYFAQMDCTPMHQGAWNPAIGGCPGSVLVAVSGGSYPTGLWTSDYVIAPGPQNFRMEVSDNNTVNFCPVHDCLVPVTSAKPFGTPPQLLIEDRAVKLLITRVAITTL
jgi:hypothetical protein